MSLIRKNRCFLLKLFYYVSSAPFLLLALFLLSVNYDDLKNDLRKAILYIKNNSNYYISSKIINILSSAEDHRFYYHIGIDQIAILRAFFVYFRYGKYQGASTLEQQFIRVVTNRYERTKKRKFREQLLALILDFYVKDKAYIAKSYIRIAFYGSGLEGLDNFLRRKDLMLETLTDNNILSLVSRLKYPEPLKKSNEWDSKIEARIIYVKKRYYKYFVDEID